MISCVHVFSSKSLPRKLSILAVISRDVSQWGEDALETLGEAISAMDESDLKKISEKVLNNVLGSLGDLKTWTKEKAKVIVNKAKEFWKKEGMLVSSLTIICIFSLYL